MKYVCWIGVYGICGGLLCCDGLCRVLFYVGSCMWRVGEATYLFHCLCTLCNSCLGGSMAKMHIYICIYLNMLVGAYVLCVSKF